MKHIKTSVKKALTLGLSLLLSFPVGAQVSVGERPVHGPSTFELAALGRVASICYDPADALVVQKVASLFSADVDRVTGVMPPVLDKLSRHCRTVVIVGTIDHNQYIRRLAREGKIDVAPLQGQWEKYLIQTVDRPFRGVDKALVVAGSDRRGAAYGLLSLSEQMGVSPWYWWADVPVQKHRTLYVTAPATYSKSPSVKYRGVFLNDEDWGLKPWAAKTFEPERGNIGPRTYAKLCELLLRLKANHLAPAMHPVSTPFYAIPENKLVADTFAITIGTSHCEPLLLNTASEWHQKEYGPWDYEKNKDKIIEVLSGRVKEAGPYENVYTLALRGLHDAAMGVGMPMKEKVRLMGEALKDQRAILERTLGRPADSIPQAFTPYKEVLDIYSNGLDVPEDVTIIWPDDNFGYLKRLSSPTERKRPGRAGVYYHVSYLGVPHSYLWFSTTPPALMYEELRKAYDTTADRIWLLNCGDLKGSEMQVSFFLDMAYDIDRFSYDNADDYPARWLASLFGQEHYDDYADVARSYYRLAFTRKPEYMGWGYWNNYWGGGEKRTDTEYSFANYNEAYDRLAEYRRIGAKAAKLLDGMTDECRPAFFQLFYYKVKGAELMNRMTIGGQIYRQYVRQQRAAAPRVRHEVQLCYDSLQSITARYNSQLDGKWNHMMSMKQNYDGTSSYFMIPLMEDSHEPVGNPRLTLQCEGEEGTTVSSYHQLPMFSKYTRRTYWVDVYNRGAGRMEWKAEPSASWIALSQTKGRTPDETRVRVSVDWGKVPAGDRVEGSVLFRCGAQEERVLVSVFNPAAPSLAQVDSLYVEDNGYVSIPAAGFHRKFENKDIRMRVIDGLGMDGTAVQMGDPLAPLQAYRAGDVPRLEYDFYTFGAGLVDVYTYVLPTFPLHADRDFKLPEHTNSDTKYSVRIDNGSIATPPTSAVEYSQAWYESVLKNCRVNKSRLYVNRPGKHTLQIRCGDPGVIVQKIVIDMGGLKRSYMGPQSTRVSAQP